jgi:hypothetical protein
VVFKNDICEDNYPDINLRSAHPLVVITRDKKLRKRGNIARADSHEQLISNAGWSKLDFFERDKCKAVLMRLSLA